MDGVILQASKQSLFVHEGQGFWQHCSTSTLITDRAGL